jgi:rod shape-determining protein MreC
MTDLLTPRRGGRASRGALLLISLGICGLLFVLSFIGLLNPVEGIAAVPLNALSGVLNRVALAITGGVSDFAELQQLRQRNADLEEALARLQPQLVEALEVQSDYQRLADLFNYANLRTDQQVIAADVIGGDPNNLLRSSTLIINRGARDGIAVGMPVVTGQGLVGRIIGVSANASQVLLITAPSSAVSARVQSSRAEGSVVGDLNGALTMNFIPLGAGVQPGDVIITSGLGGNFPPDILIGQVSTVSQTELYQVAQLRSLINFDIVELALVITNFQPIDLSVLDAQSTPVP